MADTKQATHGFKPSIHAKTCPEFHQKANAENDGCVQDSAFPCNCGADKFAASRSDPDRTTPEEKLAIQPQLADVMKDLDYRGIHWDAELAEEGTGWEVAAEPEPQYFETLREALDFFVSLKEPQADLDRTTPDLSKLLPATFFADRDLAFRIERMVTAWQRAIVINQLQAGPDRGQQDAPDTGPENDVCAAQRCGGKRWAHTDEYAVEMGTNHAFVEAKAAREGQAPKGDRIKVELEPGCKCEYAIWTNARGCPLHDVQGKSSDSEKLP